MQDLGADAYVVFLSIQQLKDIITSDGGHHAHRNKELGECLARSASNHDDCVRGMILLHNNGIDLTGIGIMPYLSQSNDPYGFCSALVELNNEGIHLNSEIEQYLINSNNAIDILTRLKTECYLEITLAEVRILNEGNILSHPQPFEFARELLKAVAVYRPDSLAVKAAKQFSIEDLAAYNAKYNDVENDSTPPSFRR